MILHQINNEDISRDIEEIIFELSNEYNIDYKILAYDQVAICKEDFENDKIDNYINELNNNSIGWLSNHYEEQRTVKKNYIIRLTFKAEASVGVYKCKNAKCKSDVFLLWQLQTRSADEPMTTFRQCLKCGSRGKE